MLQPSRPGQDDIGRLNTPGHLKYLVDCRWCGQTLKRNLHEAGALACTTCDVPAVLDYPHASATD